ncbi:hypothetical protein NKG94_21920 [Micromonospora sp. M12]
MARLARHVQRRRPHHGDRPAVGRAGGVGLARRRRAAGATSAWRTSLAEVGIVYGTVPWVWMIMLPGERAGVVPGRVSLVPLRDVFTIVSDGGR